MLRSEKSRKLNQNREIVFVVVVVVVAMFECLNV